MSKYLRFDSENIANLRVRMMTCRPEEAMALPNGTLVKLGDMELAETTPNKVAEREIHVALAPEGTEIAVVQMPEINYKDDSRVDRALGDFRNREGAPLACVILSNHDVLGFSEDYFVGGIAGLKVGDVVKINATLAEGAQLEKTNAVVAGQVNFKVIQIKDSSKAVTVVYDKVTGKAVRKPAPYKMVSLEVIIA